jgi:DNA-binding transcriptional ArsR family regulator
MCASIMPRVVSVFIDVINFGCFTYAAAVPEFARADIEACRLIAAAWAPTLRALGNEERLLIALWLADEARSVRELEQATGMSQSLVSYHLRELREAGLATVSPQGRRNLYRLRSSDLDQVASLIGSLDTSDRDET